MTDYDVILEQIKGLRDDISELKKDIKCGSERCRDRHTTIDVRMAEIGARAGFYGAIAGAVPAIVAIIIFVVKYG